MHSAPVLEIYSDSAALMKAEAERVVELARQAIEARGRFSVALAGGSTPRPLYELLASAAFAPRIAWAHVHVFWGDERCVPPAHGESNYRMVREALLDRVELPPANVHRIAGEAEPLEAARAYEQELRAYFGVPEGAPRRSFDLVLLGMGTDGHTASLFPDTPPVTEEERWVMATHVARPQPTWRITLTPVAINAAAIVTFLVAGAAKAARLAEVVEGRGDGLPVQRIRPTHGVVHWMVDVSAAAQLRRSP